MKVKIDNARKLLDVLTALQKSYSSKITLTEDKTATIMLTCDVRLNLREKDAIKLESDFKAAMNTLLAPYIDQNLRDLQNEVNKSNITL